MTHPQDFLLQKIVESNKENKPSLGQLDAKHVKDLASVMEEFTEKTIIETLEKLKNGGNVIINGVRYTAKGK